MFEKFSEQSIQVILLAQEETRRQGHSFVGTEQLLLGLIAEESGRAAQALKSAGVTLDDARREVDAITGRGQAADLIEVPFTPRTKEVLKFAFDAASNSSVIQTEHLLMGILEEGDGVAIQVLKALGVDLSELRRHLDTLLNPAVELDLTQAHTRLGTHCKIALVQLQGLTSNLNDIRSYIEHLQSTSFKNPYNPKTESAEAEGFVKDLSEPASKLDEALVLFQDEAVAAVRAAFKSLRDWIDSSN